MHSAMLKISEDAVEDFSGVKIQTPQPVFWASCRVPELQGQEVVTYRVA